MPGWNAKNWMMTRRNDVIEKGCRKTAMSFYSKQRKVTSGTDSKFLCYVRSISQVQIKPCAEKQRGVDAAIQTIENVTMSHLRRLAMQRM